ncbi:MAG: hypothetical protein AB7O59_05385 [Pirellulales bacterium]
MSGSRTTSVWDSLAHSGLVARLCLVSGLLALVWCLAASIAYSLAGSAGVVAASVAAAVCWLGGAVALLLTALARGPSMAMYGVALAMLSRTLLPLALGVSLHFAVPALAAAGLVYYLLVFYLVVLAAETLLAVAQISQFSGPHEAM